MRTFIYATYTELFGKKINKVLNELFVELNFSYACKILSEMGYHRREKDEKNIQKIFFRLFPEKNVSKYRSYLKKRVLITRHGVLLAWENIMRYRNKMSDECCDFEEQQKCIFKLVLIMQEMNMQEQEDTNIEHFVYVNAAYNYYDNQAGQCARAYYLFIKNEDDVTEIDIRFKEKYGISIKEYIYWTVIVSSFISNMHEYITKEKRYFSNNWHIEMEALPGIREDKKGDLLKYLDLISFPATAETMKFDELYFTKYPLIKIESNYYLPIERRLFDNLVFNSLIYKINDCYSGDMSFYNKLGMMFQKYVDYICKKFCENSQGRYLYIGEFSYGKPKSDSPDIMIVQKIKEKNYVIVIEVKAARLLYQTTNYMNVTDEYIKKSAEKVIIKPLGQAFDAIAKIVKAEVKKELNADAEYIFLTVTMNNFPGKRTFLNEVAEEAQKYSSDIKICDFNAICIEELELLLQVLKLNLEISFSDIFATYGIDKSDSLKNLLRQFPTQKDNRDMNLLFEEYLWHAFGGASCFDAVTNLNDECCKNAVKHNLYQNIKVPSIGVIFEQFLSPKIDLR